MSKARLPEADTAQPKHVLGELDDVRIEVEVGTRSAAGSNRENEGTYAFLCRFKVSNCGSKPVRLMARRWRLCDAYHHLKELHGPCIPGQQPVILPGASYSFQVTLVLPTEWGDFSGSIHIEDYEGKAHEVAFAPQMLVPGQGMPQAQPQLSPTSL
jgi:ApaG protein